MKTKCKKFLASDFFYHFKNSKTAVISFIILIIFIILSLMAPFIAPHDPYDPAMLDIMNAELPPIWQNGADENFLLGTDSQGRDILSTILYGTRLSLIIGFFAVCLQVFLGIVIGLVSGYFGGRVDSFFMRLADIQLSFSTLMVAIVFLAIFQAAFGAEFYSQTAMLMLILVIGIAEWPQYARTIRSCVLAEKKKEYVEATKIMGFKSSYIMFRHILPNVLSPILVISTVQIANAIISEASLSFLGLGMPQTKPSLGSLISNGFEYIFSGSWWITVIPGIVLVLLIFVINLLGDFVRDAMNPKLCKGP